MKKQLLIGMALTLAPAAFAADDYVVPAEVYDMAAQRVNQAGTLVAGQDANGSVVYGYEVATGTTYEYYGFSIGNGNCVSDNGKIVGQQLGAEPQGCIMADGNAEVPSTLANRGLSTIDAITPDGRRVCGFYQGTSSVMYVPFVMDISSSGKYGVPVALPYPNKDFFGNAPQFVNAISISDDGKTIAGFVQDSTGFFAWPIVYKQDANGTWRYSEPTKFLFNPENLPLSKNPEDVVWGENGAPAQPNYLDFMSSEAIAEWMEALETDPDASPFTFMSEQDYADYMAAVAKFDKQATDYLNSLFDDYWKYMYRLGKDEQFALNMLSLSPDGKYLVVDKGEADEETTTENMAGYSLWRFNLEDGTYETFVNPRNTHLLPKQILKDGTLVTTTPKSDFLPFTAYMLEPGQDDFTPFMEWLEAKFPAYCPWLEDSVLTQYGVIGYGPDGEALYGMYTITGYISISDDYKVIAGGYPVDPAFSYIYSGSNAEDGVEEVFATDSEEDAPYFNLQGIRVPNPTPGIYIRGGKKVIVRP